MVKKSTYQCRRHKRLGFNPWVGEIPGGGNDNPLQYSCLGNLIDKRSLAGYSRWDCKELDMTEHTHTHKAERNTLKHHYYSKSREKDTKSHLKELNYNYI